MRADVRNIGAGPYLIAQPARVCNDERREAEPVIAQEWIDVYGTTILKYSLIYGSAIMGLN